MGYIWADLSHPYNLYTLYIKILYSILLIVPFEQDWVIDGDLL